MVKLICHASLLRVDDARLGSLSRVSRLGPLRNHFANDDVKHLLQCPVLQDGREQMSMKINDIPDSSGQV